MRDLSAGAFGLLGLVCAACAPGALAQDDHDHAHHGSAHDHDHDDHHQAADHADHDHDQGHDHDHDQGEGEDDALAAGGAPHVHGHAELLMALDGQALFVEFRSPLWNILGFEHQPRTQAQVDAIVQARATFRDVDQIVTLSEDAECVMQTTDIGLPLLAIVQSGGVSVAAGGRKDHAHDHDAQSPAHDHDHDDDHGHEHTKPGRNSALGHEQGHGRGGHAGHGHHGDHGHSHGHDHGDDHGTHSDIHVYYTFDCAQPERLSSVALGVFDFFDGVERVSAVLLTDAGETSGDLLKNTPILSVQ